MKIIKLLIVFTIIFQLQAWAETMSLSRNNLNANATALNNENIFIEQHVTLNASEIENQTIPPTALEYTRFSYTEIYLSWEPIPYTQNNGVYEIWIATSDNENYTKYGETTDILTKAYTISGLDETLDYYIKLRTITQKDNSVWESEFTQVFESKTFDRKEREALIALYESTDGDNWKKNDGWLGPIGTECGWYGISCGGVQKYIRHLYLVNNSLSGKIPFEIGWLTGIHYLYLNMNQLTEIPKEIGNLNNLRILSLGNNQLIEIPKEIGNLINLTSLYLGNNQLIEIPKEIGNLINLTTLSLYNNQLIKIQEQIGNLINLTTLSLSNNQLTEIPEPIGSLTNLTTLSLDNNQLAEIPEQIGNLINLTRLYLDNNQLTEIPEPIGSLTNLTELCLDNNQLTEIPEQIGNLINLTRLYLGNNQLAEIPEQIGNLTNLTYLTLKNNQLTEIPEPIGSLTNLTYLTLKNNQLTELPEQIGNLTNLTILDISFNCLYTNNVALKTFLNALGYDWESTQTIAPINITATSTCYSQVHLSWDPILFSRYSGAYEIWIATSENSAYTYIGETTSKKIDNYTINDLELYYNYYVKIRTITETYEKIYISEFSPPISISSPPKYLYMSIHHEIFENDALIENVGRIYLSKIATTNLTINLISENPSKLTLPNSVTIPQGYSSTNFSLSVIDNDLINGSQYVMITATALNFITDSVTIDIIDDENTQLSLTIPESITENQGFVENFGNISISGILLYDLNVQLTVSDPTELVLPETIVIPAGTRSMSFTASIIDDSLYDGSQFVGIKASATNFLSDEKNIVIHDTVTTPLISTSQHHILFDKTYVNHTNATTITITNNGNRPLSITQTQLSNSKHYTIPTNSCDTHILNPSESCQITLMFSPIIYGSHQTELSIYSNDPYTPVETISINGTAALFDLSLQDCFLPYTSIAGESMAISWIVKNTEGYTTTGNQIHTIYMSSDNQPGNDIQLYNFSTTKILAKEKNITEYAYIDFPDHIIGDQWIVFEIKTSNPDIEFSENNNTKICGPVQIMDKTPPVTSFSADGLVFFDGTQYYARKNVQYRLEAQDMYGSVQTIEYQIDNYSFRPYTSAFTLNTDGDHAISFRARDNSGNWEILKTILVKVEIPPDTPEGLEGQYINSKIQLTWLPNDESDFSHYFVYQNQEKIPVSDYSYDVYEASIGLDVPINAIYTYQVSAVNKTGLESNLSAPIKVSAYSESFVILLPHTETYVIDPQLTISGLIKENVRLGFCVNGQLQYSLVTMPEGTFEVSDILLAEGENVITCAVLDSNDLLSEASDPIIIHYIKRPHTPENIEAVPGDTTISLLWNDSNETDIIGYYIYRNNEKLLYQFAPITQPSFTDTRLSNHMSYTYAVTCVDSKYIESLPTNPVVATPIAGDWKIQGKRKKRTSRQMETFSLFAPSQHNVITIDIINNRSPMRSRTFTVTAAMDQVITITDGISKKKRIKAGQQQAFAFTFDIVCLAEDKNHLLTFTIADDSGYESTITKLLAITTTLNKCQSCSNDQVVGIHCPEKECMISMGCHPSSGCTYIQEEKTQCNIDIGDSGHIHFVGDNLCQTVPSHFFSPVTSTGRQDKLSIEIPMNEASKISVGIYQPDSEWVKSIIHQQIFTSEKISVEWDGKAADGTLMDDGLYHLIITRDNNITRQYIHVDNVYPKADISHIFQPSDTCIEIHGTATDSNIYTATIECLSCTETEFDIYMKPLPVSDDLIAILNTNEMKASGYTICLKVADKAGNERICYVSHYLNQ